MKHITYDWETYKYSKNFRLCGKSRHSLLKDIETTLCEIDHKVFIRRRIRRGLYDVHIATKTSNGYYDAETVLMPLTPLWRSVREWEKQC